MSVDPYDILRSPQATQAPPAPAATDPYDVLRATPRPAASPASADPYDVFRAPVAPTLQDRAAQAQQEALGLPGEIVRTVGNAPGIAQIGQAWRAIAPAIGNAPGIAQIGQAARAIGKVAGIGLGSEGVERALTGAASGLSGKPIQSYDEMFQAQGADPVGAHVLGALFRGTLQPSNLLVAPGAIAATLGTGAKIAKTGANLARATGLTEPAAQAVGTAGRLMTEGRLTGPIIRAVAAAATKGAPLLDKYAGTPPAFRQGISQYFGDLRTGIGAALQHQQDILAAVPLESDRVILGQALTGRIPEAQIPERLRAVYKELIYPGREATTTKALESGVLQTARENYMRRYYSPETYAKIKAGATGPLPVPADVAAETPPLAATGRATRVPAPEVRAQQIAEALPEEGRRSAFGRQVEPTKGMRGLTSGFQKQRVLSEDASVALGAIQDPAVALPAHQLEVDHQIANRNLYQRITELGPDWVRPDGADVPTNWLGMQQVVGVGAAERYGWSNLRVHPQIAQAIADITGGRQYGFSQMLAIPTAMNNALKRVIFLNPMVHGANQVRAAYLSQGWNLLNPKYWTEVGDLVRDAREMGPVTQARLAAGGSIPGGSIGRQIGETIDEIFTRAPVAGSVRQAGLLGRAAAARGVQEAKGITKAPAFVKALNDEILWNVMDAGGRNYSFQYALDQIGKAAPQMAQEERARAAARYADLVWNDYSKAHYGPIEKVLNSMMFVYPWTRGRAKLFAALARSYVPSGAADIGLYRQMAGRWALMNEVLPHIYRAWHDKQSAGFEAARIPAATYQDNYGRTQQVYIKPTGWYNDAVEMIQDPAGFALARLNPGFRIVGGLYETARDARKAGRNVTQAVLDAFMPKNVASILSNVYPAGLGQALTPQPIPLRYRLYPSLGIGVSGPPPSENPRTQMQGMFDRGDYFQAGTLARQNGISLTQTLAQLPAGDPRRQFLRGYHSGNIPGMPTLKLPALPRVP